MTWVGAIADLYHQNGLRLQADPGSALYAAHHARLQQAVHDLATRRDEALADPRLADPAHKVLHSMQNHWSGLTVFVEHPWVPMDNNAERDVRQAVVGRKNFYGSGSAWSGQLAATMYSLLMTVKLWGSIRVCGLPLTYKPVPRMAISPLSTSGLIFPGAWRPLSWPPCGRAL